MSGRFLLAAELKCVSAGPRTAWHKARVSGTAVVQRYPLHSGQGAFLAIFMGTLKALYSCFTQSVHPLKYRKRREREVILYCCSENGIYWKHAAF